jgi:formate hydrogenlyase transcriptional activator
MEYADLSLPGIEGNSSRFTPSGPLQSAEIETNGSAEPGIWAELQRARSRLKLLLELANQTVSHQELLDLVCAVMMSIRSSVLCDRVCLCLESQEGGQLEVYALNIPDKKGFHERTIIPRSGTIAEHVAQTAHPWSGSRQEECAYFSTQFLLMPGFTTGCVVPIPGRDHVVGTLGLVRCSDNPFSQAEIDLLMQVSNQIAIAVEKAMAYQQIRELKKKLARETVCFEDELHDETGFEEIVGKSTALRSVLAKVRTVAPTDSTVLICGETGTGKELIAQAIHNLSPRQGNTFVKLNGSAIPTGLLESELFGHEKGAFTGAITQRIGRFELAHRGTVFLDEVGEIPLELQTKLLRVAQEREFERVGSSRTIRTDARLIAATNRDLAEMVGEHRFRSDLFYRLNVFPIRVPALRERQEDIPLLVRHFVQLFARRMNRVIDTISCESMNALVRYSWPGNIRELQNLIERAVILSTGPVLRIPLQELQNRVVVKSARPQTMEDAERAHILATLEDTKWVIAGPNGAAARLGMNRSTVQFRMKKLGIVKPWKLEN